MSKIWIDPQGREIPDNRVTKDEKRAERLISKVLKQAEKTVKQLTELKELMVGDVMEYLEDSAHYAELENWKGNATITDFSATTRLIREVKEQIDFNENIQICQQIIQNKMEDWAKRANVNLKKVIDHTFKPNSKGKLSRTRLLGLKRIQIEDSEWQRAMEYLDKSIKVVDTKAYYAVEMKDSNGEWQRLPLNFYDINIELEDEESESKAA